MTTSLDQIPLDAVLNNLNFKILIVNFNISTNFENWKLRFAPFELA